MIKKDISHKILFAVSMLLALARPAFGEGTVQHSVAAGGGAGYLLNGLDIYETLIDSKVYGLGQVETGFRPVADDGDYYSWAFNRPISSLGFSYIGTGSLKFKGDSRMGDLFTLYGSFQADLVRTSVFGFGPYVNLGATYTRYKYDPVTNPANFYVGSNVIVLIGAGFDFHFRAGKHFEPGLRLGMSHRSNGMLRVPNFGLNKLQASVYLRYNIDDNDCGRREGPGPEMPQFKKWNWDVYFSGGVHSCDVERGINDERPEGQKWELSHPWLRLNLGACCSYRYHPIFSTGVGVDLFYTQNARRLEECEKQISGRDVKLSPFYCGTYLQQNFRYKNVVASIGFGVYLYKNLGPEDSGWNYQRAAIRFYMPKASDIFVGFAMRAHSFDRSDTLEFTFGKRF